MSLWAAGSEVQPQLQCPESGISDLPMRDGWTRDRMAGEWLVPPQGLGPVVTSPSYTVHESQAGVS